MDGQPKPRICKRGHLVSLEAGTGEIQRSAPGKVYLRCLPCRRVYEDDLARMGMRPGGWGQR